MSESSGIVCPEVLLRIATKHAVTSFESDLGASANQSLMIDFGSSNSGGMSTRGLDRSLVELLNLIRNACVRSLSNRIRNKKFKELIRVEVKGLAISSENKFFYAVTLVVDEEMAKRAGLDTAESVEELRATVRNYIRDSQELMNILKNEENGDFGALSIEAALEKSSQRKGYNIDAIRIANKIRETIGLDDAEAVFEIAVPITAIEVDSTIESAKVDFETAVIELTEQKSTLPISREYDGNESRVLRNCRVKSATSITAEADGVETISVKAGSGVIVMLLCLSRLKIDVEVTLEKQAIQNRGKLENKYKLVSIMRTSKLGLDEFMKFKSAVNEWNISTSDHALDGFYSAFGFEEL